ncbi:hypothetical protein Ga0123462_1307 [Mariprofundus ferrinatatus]|uniref:Energy-coupling factor transporter transmembrane protein EcfT n=2 Tax=Mariprofundus ferrinatatus TaxID=1921087 RepID=A0A2K8L8H5_9PROT|nr:hypothetical protein Ga0123462_1307 [Mariprofundus ferrinatatus]
MTASNYYAIHPLSRFLVGLAMLSLAIAAHAVTYGLLFMLLSALMIRFIEGGWTRVIRISGLLRWFVIPIIVLHSCFSPGQFLFPDIPLLPLTYEGLLQGVRLSLHLSAIYLGAALLFLCLRQSEWFKGLLLLPFISRELLIYLMIMAPLKRSVGAVLLSVKHQWQMRKSWRSAPQLLVSAFRSTLMVAADQSRLLWLRWPGSPVYIEDQTMKAGGSLVGANLLTAAFGVAGLVMAWKI